MLSDLSQEHRLLLLKFVCAFAWADMEVSDREREFVERLVKNLALSEEDAAQVRQWLAVSPSPQSVDPKRIPPEHRQAFIESVRALIYVDGRVDPEERESFERLKATLST